LPSCQRARTSSMRSSSDGAPATLSEIPVPRLSKTMQRTTFASARKSPSLRPVFPAQPRRLKTQAPRARHSETASTFHTRGKRPWVKFRLLTQPSEAEKARTSASERATQQRISNPNVSRNWSSR
jgi:hypothetical protein